MRLLLGGLLAGALVSSCAVGGGGTSAGTPVGSTPAGPTAVGSDAQVSLSASLVNSGPRAYSFVAQITGGRTDDSSLYCLPTTWGFGDGPALTVTPSCAPWAAGMTVPTRLESSHTYSAAGRYVVTFGYGSLTAETTVDVR